MIRIKEVKRGIGILDVWYAGERVKENGIIRYREAKEPFFDKSQKVRTLLTDLMPKEEDIVGKFTKNCRYEIRRAPREGVTVSHYLGQEITAQVCDDFLQYYDAFWRSKGVTDTDIFKQRHEIMKYAKSGCFAITEAKIGEVTVVYHTYVVGDDIVRLYQSASHFRVEEQIAQSVVGMANRYLHKEDLLWFKGLGKISYDWGGAGEREEVASITRFKEAFGGEEAYFYNGEEVIGWKAKLYRKLIAFVNQLQK